MSNYYFGGALAGFAFFLYQTSTIGNIYIRENEAKNKVYTVAGLHSLIKQPFTAKYWQIVKHIIRESKHDRHIIVKNLHLLKLNWIAMTLLGSLIVGTCGPYLI